MFWKRFKPFDLEVPFLDKEQAKSLGARWDQKRKTWYAPSERIKEKCVKWWPGSDFIPLNVPFEEKDAAKSLGAKWDSHESTWFAQSIAIAEKCEQWRPVRPPGIKDLRYWQANFDPDEADAILVEQADLVLKDYDLQDALELRSAILKRIAPLVTNDFMIEKHIEMTFGVFSWAGILDFEKDDIRSFWSNIETHRKLSDFVKSRMAT